MTMTTAEYVFAYNRCGNVNALPVTVLLYVPVTMKVNNKIKLNGSTIFLINLRVLTLSHLIFHGNTIIPTGIPIKMPSNGLLLARTAMPNPNNNASLTR